MIRRLRERRQLSRMRSEGRSERRRVGRWVYIALLLVLFGWLFQVFVGRFFWLRADGMVLRDSVEIGVEYTGTVVDLTVREGETVQEGELVARLTSQGVLGQLAGLSTDYTQVLGQLVALRIDRQVNQALLPSAVERVGEASALWDNFRSLGEKGVATQDRIFQALKEHYESLQDHRRMQEELDVLNEEWARLEASLGRINGAIATLEARYDGGALRAPVGGIVGDLPVRKGSVVRPGDPVLRLYTGAPFVLVYLSTGTLYEVAVGRAVEIQSGLRTYRGEIAKIWPLAAQVPVEFQKSFGPRERGQLAEVRFTGEEHPPLFSTVTISGIGWPPW